MRVNHIEPEQPKIDIFRARIPWEPGARLGEDCNRIIAESRHPYVCIMDDDFLMLHELWYLVAQHAINRLPNTGIFTCWTNTSLAQNRCNVPPNIPKRLQDPNKASIGEHREFAIKIWRQYGYELRDIPHTTTGMFMIIKRAAWAETGGFPGGGLFGQDDGFCEKLLKTGYQITLICGLYGYHLRNRQPIDWGIEHPTSATIWKERKQACNQ